MTLSNLPLPDRLAALRAEIKRLEDEESEIRRLLLLNEDMRTGAEWIAEIAVTRQNKTDLKELKACYPDIVAEHTHPTEITRIVLSGINEETGEIVSARKMRTQSAQTER